MRDFLYKSAPIILIILGILSWSLFFVLGYYIKLNLILIWIPFFLFQITGGLFTGILIRKLHYYSIHDTLTNLFNRKHFYIKLKEELQRTDRTKRPLSLILADLDNFKKVNDTFGHVVGDEVLKKTADFLLKFTRSIDVAVRWGGEEFAIILPETEPAAAYICAERIRETIQEFLIEYRVTISIGIATTTELLDCDKFVVVADNALYKAKETKNFVSQSACKKKPENVRFFA